MQMHPNKLKNERWIDGLQSSVFDPENKPSIQSVLNSSHTEKWAKYIIHQTMTSLYKKAKEIKSVTAISQKIVVLDKQVYRLLQISFSTRHQTEQKNPKG